jgi:hypothetical protein
MEAEMRAVGLMAAFAAVGMLAACESTDRYDTRASGASSASDPLGALLGGILGGGSGSSLGRAGDSRDYDEEMDRLEAEQRRLDRERAAIDRRYGRSRY